ncbi:hydroxymyristoyl-ACP dehydratase [Clostridium niameyense]|uniref:Hydroxymyristoyl-ACP dehydratase n=1 Tax=Clostridium niameyense TaxID=1622073 RepID=A0A6M0R9B6_9CLOT|nr:hypothetical protein [Clostridium niameyense]NEZ46833.1 hydroxymyristoyl-ACP dehydratase [Clostridium niameyense]
MTIACSEKCKHNKDGRCILNYIDSFLSIHNCDAHCAYFIPKNIEKIKKAPEKL